jgi:hypothetical protein
LLEFPLPGRKERNLGTPILRFALVLALTGCGTATAAASHFGGAGAPARCPTRPPTSIRPNPWPPTHAKLAPAGAAAIRLCRYSGLNSNPALRLTRSVLIGDGRTVRSLSRLLARLPPFMGTTACPADDNSQILALLAYPRGHRVMIDVHLRGCNQVTNGNLTRSALRRPGSRLIAQLGSLTS